ncbi:MAG: esterase [Betaproteobacteria bacterium]|nr:esterase [Betaproteobacteria bacterium]
MAPTIVYLHGFASSPASVKARALAGCVEALPAALRPRLLVPALQFSPREAIERVAALVRDEVPGAPRGLTFVGSSLGGFYAVHLAERFGARAVLINPAIRPYDDLSQYAGTQRNLYTGEAFEVTASHFDELRALAVPRITLPERYFLMVQTGDEVLDWREAVAYFGGAFQLVEGGGDHGFANFAAHVPELLRFARVPTP